MEKKTITIPKQNDMMSFVISLNEIMSKYGLISAAAVKAEEQKLPRKSKEDDSDDQLTDQQMLLLYGLKKYALKKYRKKDFYSYYYIILHDFYMIFTQNLGWFNYLKAPEVSK